MEEALEWGAVLGAFLCTFCSLTAIGIFLVNYLFDRSPGYWSKK